MQMLLRNKLVQTPEITLENQRNINQFAVTTTAIAQNALMTAKAIESLEQTKAIKTQSDTVYGTYDAKTNSITIVMDDDAMAVSESLEEIYSDEISSSSAAILQNNDVSLSRPVASPSEVYLNVTTCTDDETEDDVLNFNPIEKFLRPTRPLVSPLAKSPTPSTHSATSDHGYESLGSQTPPSFMSPNFEPLTDVLDDFVSWPSSFNDLFPNLM